MQLTVVVGNIYTTTCMGKKVVGRLSWCMCEPVTKKVERNMVLCTKAWILSSGRKRDVCLCWAVCGRETRNCKNAARYNSDKPIRRYNSSVETMDSELYVYLTTRGRIDGPPVIYMASIYIYKFLILLRLKKWDGWW